jgi:translation elongation factor EF-Ts
MEYESRAVKELRDRIGVGTSVANELLVLSGGDIDLAEHASRESAGLDQCKAKIIDCRFKRIEER